MKKYFGTGRKISLVGKIKGMSEEQKRIRIKMRNATSEDEHQKLQIVEDAMKKEIRAHMLVYAYLRGIPYLIIEKKCSDKPIIELILRAVESHILYFDKEREKESIKKWLSEGPSLLEKIASKIENIIGLKNDVD